MWSAVTPSLPLRSMALPMVSLMVVTRAARASSSALAGVMIPSPLNFVSANIFTLSAVSSSEMLSFSSLRFWRICLAEASSLAPSGFSVLK